MAFGRLSERARASQAIWPGFVDAMTALLLVLMFVLSIFMLVQFVLRATITGQESRIEQQENELQNLSAQLSQLSNVLAMEQTRADDLESELGVARATLSERNQEIDQLGALVASLTNDRNALETRVASFEAQVASLLAERASLEENVASLTQDVASLEAANAAEISAKEALQIALAKARDELDAELETARLAAAQREAMEALIASLEADKAAGEEQISALKAEEAANLALIAALEAEKAETAEEQAEALRRIASLESALTEEERLKLAEIAAAKALRERLQNADAELTAMTLALEEKRKEAEETLALLAAAEAAREDLASEKAELLASLSDEEAERERNAAIIALARERLKERETEISAQAKNLALLNEQAAELRAQLAQLSAQLDSSEAKDAAAQVEIARLGSRLNAALARELQLKAKEAARLKAERESLEAYRSEFFGEMRKALGERRDIKIVGDRFIFQSEVLFSSGSAELDPAGRAELAELGGALREVIDRIPPSIDWLLVVEGHTDNVPLGGTGKYANNWELSQGRALSVVTFLADGQGIPPDRLAALGYGEYQPVDTASTPEARARNRRIELKFAERPPRIVAQ